MKDKIIEKNLNMYAESWRKDERLLSGAYLEMEKRQFSKPKNKNAMKRFVGFAAAAVIIAIAVISTFVFFANQNNLDGLTSAGQYKLEELSKTSATFSDLYATDGVKILTGFESNSTLNSAYIYSKDEKIKVAVADYVVINRNHADMVRIISDLDCGLKDYILYAPEKDNALISVKDIYEMGEYYSYFSIKKNGIDYYFIISSPVRDSWQIYQDVLSDFQKT